MKSRDISYAGCGLPYYVGGNIEGREIKGVFTVRTSDDAAIGEYIENNGCRKAVVAGAGFIGMEMAEDLAERKLSVTVLI